MITPQELAPIVDAATAMAKENGCSAALSAEANRALDGLGAIPGIQKIAGPAGISREEFAAMHSGSELTGLNVRVADLGTTQGMLIKDELIGNRQMGATGELIGPVPGHGGDVWLVQHPDGARAPYSVLEELEPAEGFRASTGRLPDLKEKLTAKPGDDLLGSISEPNAFHYGTFRVTGVSDKAVDFQQTSAPWTHAGSINDKFSVPMSEVEKSRLAKLGPLKVSPGDRVALLGRSPGGNPSTQAEAVWGRPLTVAATARNGIAATDGQVVYVLPKEYLNTAYMKTLPPA